jgi:hypothetical protein
VNVGGAQLKRVKLRELIDLYVEYLEKDPDLFYGTQANARASHESKVLAPDQIYVRECLNRER